MSLRDHLPTVAGKPGRRHRVIEILADLDVDDRAALEEWLADLRYSPEKISAELRREGITISPASIARYRFNVLGLGSRQR